MYGVPGMTNSRVPETLPGCIQSGLRRGAEAYRNKFGDARLLHGYTVQHRGDAHGFLAVSDEDELGLDAHFFNQFGEAADVGFIERGVDFVEDAEGAGRILEDADQEGERRERFFSTGKQENALQALAGRRGHDVDPPLGAI